MNRVAILGMGLMGGSLALALRRRAGLRVQVYARRAETRETARALGLADAIEAEPEAAVREADRVVVCVPVERIPDLIRACLPGLRPGAVLTDVGSTKAWVQAEATRALEGTDAVFVGSHPIAGSERQGLDAARADLYQGAMTILTPNGADASAVAQVSRLWASVGSRVRCMDAREHDRALARTSHLPHLAAAALAAVTGRDADADTWRDFCGAGFRDSTRIAEGGPELWVEIVRTNREAIVRELEAFSGRIKALADAIRSGHDRPLHAMLEEGRRARRRLTGAEEAEDRI